MARVIFQLHVRTYMRGAGTTASWIRPSGWCASGTAIIQGTWGSCAASREVYISQSHSSPEELRVQCLPGCPSGAGRRPSRAQGHSAVRIPTPLV